MRNVWEIPQLFLNLVLFRNITPDPVSLHPSVFQVWSQGLLTAPYINQIWSEWRVLRHSLSFFSILYVSPRRGCPEVQKCCISYPKIPNLLSGHWKGPQPYRPPKLLYTTCADGLYFCVHWCTSWHYQHTLLPVPVTVHLYYQVVDNLNQWFTYVSNRV